MGGFPAPGQGRRQDTTDRLIPERKRKRQAEVERHRRMHLDKCFSCFDVLERGRVPSAVVWGGLALMTGAPEVAKVKFVLAMYDADRLVTSSDTALKGDSKPLLKFIEVVCSTQGNTH